MGTFKVGDKVICVLDSWFDTETGEKDKPFYPKKGDTFIIDGIHSGAYLSFEEIQELDEKGKRHFFYKKGFRKVQHDYRNEETASLVKKFKTDQQEMKELQADELKIFTVDADF